MAYDYASALKKIASGVSPVLGTIVNTAQTVAGAAQSAKANPYADAGFSSLGYTNGQYTGPLGFRDDGTKPYSAVSTASQPEKPATPKPDDLPEGMSYAEALQRAQKSLNPQYDTARGRLEQQYSQLREQNPQIMAARYGGLSGIRGGRLKSAQATTTQREAQSIDENERSRITAVEQLAQGLQNEDYQRQMQAYQLAEQLKQAQYNAVYQQYRDALEMARHDKDQAYDWQKTLLAWQQDNDQFDKTFGYQEARDKISDTRYDTEWSASPQSQNWYLDLYKQGLQADIQNTLRSANAPYGGGGGGGGLTPYQQYQISRDALDDENKSQADMDAWVRNQVANDYRLNSDYSNYAALYDAWKNMYIFQNYGGK